LFLVVVFSLFLSFIFSFDRMTEYSYNLRLLLLEQMTASHPYSFSLSLSLSLLSLSGHMVPRDQPKVALAMLNAFIFGKI